MWDIFFNVISHFLSPKKVFFNLFSNIISLIFKEIWIL